jgi:ribosome-associated protein
MELSRSEQKRRVKELEELIAELAELPAALLDQLPADEAVRSLLTEAAAMGHDGARKRQIKYITKLLREDAADTDALYQFLAERKSTELHKKKQHHELEHMRDALIEEAISFRCQAQECGEEVTENWPSQVAGEIAAELPTANQNELTRLAFFFSVSRNPRHSRELFRLLRAAQEQVNREAGRN